MHTVKRLSVLLTALALSLPVWSQSATNNPPLSLAVELTDGSRLLGIPAIKSIRIQTPYAKFNIPLQQARSFRIDRDHEIASVELLNGDKLKGALILEQLELAAVFGKVAVEIGYISAIQVLQSASLGLPAQLRDGLVLYCSFDREQGRSPEDVIPPKADYQVHGATWTPEGRRCGAYIFKDSYVSLGDVDALELKDRSLSFAAWFKTANTGNRVLLSKHSTASPYKGYTLGVYYGGKVVIEASESYPSLNYALITSEPVYADNHWHLAVGVINHAEQKTYIYVDGMKKAASSTANMGSPDAAGIPFQIGRRGTRTNEFFDGAIDEVMVWNRPLSRTEIELLYHSQKEGRNSR